MVYLERERNATLELMKYSVNGNHLNTHIVNMCCCNAINRVLITPARLFFFVCVCVRMCCPASCTMSVFDGDMAFQRWRSVSNAMKTYYVTQIGRNTLKTTNRQLFDMSIELPNVTKERCSKREWCAPVLHGCKAQRNIYVNFVEFFFFIFTRYYLPIHFHPCTAHTEHPS